MCQFFSCISDGKGVLYYFKPEHRKIIYAGEKLDCKVGVNQITTRSELDSHSSIAAFYGLDDDKVNKYEYRPLDKHFDIDQTNTTDDSKKVKRKLKRLDYKELLPPEVVLKPIIHPFKKLNRRKATKNDLLLLKKWASVEDSVGASVGDSVWDSVWASVGASVGASVWDSVGASVWDSVGASVWDSVGDSVGAYIGSFFNLPKWKYVQHKEGEYPYQPLVDLWEKGVVPSLDGEVWRLHGYKGKIIKTITKDELKAIK